MLKYSALKLLIFLAFGFSAFGQETLSFPPVHHNPIKPGETIEYKVSVGFFTVGKAQITTSPKLYRINGRPCYKMDVRGKTSGALDWVASVDDNWGAYLDTTSFLPFMGYRNIKENSYRKNELTKFDQEKQLVELKVINQKTGEFNESKIFMVMEPVRDVVAGSAYLRTLDYDKFQPGDTISLYGVFEDEIYNFNILYGGKEILKTKLGNIKSFKLIPVMPNNQIFAGENSITIWFSDDQNKIPLKIEANMFVGKAGCEIISYSSLKEDLVYQQALNNR